jgi:hypothetical protein
VFLKLFVVHLTTIAAFCHVLSLRRERIWSWRFIAYLLYPSTILAAHALAIVIFAGAVIYWALFDRTRRFRKSLSRAPRLLLAAAPLSEPSDVPEESEPMLKTGGRVLTACAFLTQCSGTVALFARRAEHDAMTWGDIRIFEVAATGVLTSFYWIAIAARVPTFVQPVPATPPDDATDLDRMIMLLRDSPLIPPAVRERKYTWLDRVLRFFGNYYLCVFTLIVKCVFVFHSPPPAKSKIFNFGDTMNWIDFFTPSAVILVALIGGSIFLFGYGIITVTDDRYPAKRPPGKYLIARGFIIFLTLTEIKLPVVLYYVWAEWFQVFEQLRELEASPVNQTCPLLWSDPDSNWIWALG